MTEPATFKEAFKLLPPSGKVFFGTMAVFVVLTPFVALAQPEGWVMMIWTVMSLFFAFILGGTFMSFLEELDSRNGGKDAS